MKQHPIPIADVRIEPFNVQDLRDWTATHEAEVSDEMLSLLGVAAREYLEGETNQVLGLVAYTLKLEGFCNYRFGIHPLNSITSVAYYADGETTPTTLADTEYALIEYSALHKELVFSDTAKDIVLADRLGKDNVIVTLSAGMEEVPQVLKTAIQLLVTTWYDEKGDSKREYPSTVSLIAKQYRVHVTA